MSEGCKQIFILAGQSNMVGLGGVINNTEWDGVVPPECTPHPDILRLSANLTWEEAHDPLHADIDINVVCGVGPGMAFANQVRARVGGTFELVPCAISGTKIKQWARGQKCYLDMMIRAMKAVIDGGELHALLWYQGESDTPSAEDAAAYKSNMEQFINDVREDLGLPCLPIIQVALASGNQRYIETVRKAQLELALQIPYVFCVDAKGLELKPDKLHLTTQAQTQLGLMLAEVYLTYIHSSTAPAS